MQNWNENDKTLEISYDGSRKLMCVEHPALVSNADKALETLGGLKNLEQVGPCCVCFLT